VFSRVRSAHNVAPAGEEGGTGIGVEGTGNAFVDCLVADNAAEGVSMYGGVDNIFVRLVAMNNAATGFRAQYVGHGTVAANVTAVNNGLHGVSIEGTGKHTLSNVLAVNNLVSGIQIDDGSEVLLANVASANNQFAGVGLGGASSNDVFTDA